ncbi:MAG: hypothetical protein JO019_02265 [Candidatus Kaiserbacteria bacterium]|nr:hypothetical protein [Candidatus Kaiserbacteria bacterium]
MQNKYVSRAQAKVKQTISRNAAAARGRNGRQEQKGKAPSSNKGRGGKMAR